ncbi:MAG: DUF2007 domain-containing protein [Gemmatimonadetes bacterium]|nr:DUF2007 domain-containing protein [Gemmatimonadota bacterium]
MIEGWTEVYAPGDEVEAQLLEGALRAEGIDAQVYSQQDHVYPVHVGELGRIRLLVPNDKVERALQIVREYLAIGSTMAPTCPSCGQPYEPGDPACPACGASLTQ